YIEEQLEVKFKKDVFTISKAVKWLVNKVKDLQQKIADLTAELENEHSDRDDLYTENSNKINKRRQR
ncbi:MAG: hypothetical protein IE878_06325, partial [Epsilonproteobacteria bacterium]|nr:hypothetical protein [Campylobacterota bacterium]